MNTKNIESFIDQTQDTACAIETLSQVLYDRIDHLYTYDDLPDNGKEQLLGLTDSIGLLAKNIHLGIVEI